MSSDVWYDVAQVCLNGHVINRKAVSELDDNVTFCTKCGAPTTKACESCGAGIRGYRHVVGGMEVVSIYGNASPPPSYCHNCGKMYTWTQASLKAAKDLTDELDKLTAEQKEELKQSIEDIVRDSPNVVTAQLRFKKNVARAGKEAAEGFQQILATILTQAALKQLGL